MLLYTSLRRLELWRSSLRTLLGISWFRARRHCHLPLWAIHRSAASLPSWVEFNCLRSPAMGKAARLLIYWQDAACRLVIPERQVALVQLYKYHHQSGKAVSSKLVWNQHNSRSRFCVSLYQGKFMTSSFDTILILLMSEYTFDCICMWCATMWAYCGFFAWWLNFTTL